MFRQHKFPHLRCSCVSFEEAALLLEVTDGKEESEVALVCLVDSCTMGVCPGRVFGCAFGDARDGSDTGAGSCGMRGDGRSCR